MGIMNKSCFDEYVFVSPGSDYGNAMWSDLRNRNNCVYVDRIIDSTNKIVNIAHHAHFSFRINQMVTMPFKSIWQRKYSLQRVNFNNNKRYCIILTDVSACRIDVEYLKKLSRKPNVSLILVFVNVVSKKKPLTDCRLKYFDRVFSFDKLDCEKYGFIYHPTIYSVPTRADGLGRKSDAFFVGSYTPKRYDSLIRLYRKMKRAGLRTDFHIVGVPSTEKRINGIKYKSLEYEEILKRIQYTDCIIEIMNNGQVGHTLRAMEAICLNKKLLTDNRTVKDLEYYNKGYIRYCNPIDSCDTDFLKNREIIDYNYRGEFSPNRLIEHIEYVCCEGIK
ncbi:MAG: hypothetical protein K6F27_00345 [Ruminococcus sp.]|nr:hypothetical protein [Ruminococcus sp.]